DVGGELDRLLYRLLGLAGKSEDERSVDRHAEIVAILGEPPRHVDPHPLFDVVEDCWLPLSYPTSSSRSPLSRSTSRVLRGTLALALHDQVTPSLPSSLAIASARGRSSVKVSSSKKNSFTCGK